MPWPDAPAIGTDPTGRYGSSASSEARMLTELISLTQRTYPECPLSTSQLKTHFLNVMDRQTFAIIVRDAHIVGYLEWQWVGQTRLLEVTELICTQPGVIWALKRKLDSLPYQVVTFNRIKTNRWRRHWKLRRPRCLVP